MISRLEQILLVVINPQDTYPVDRLWESASDLPDVTALRGSGHCMHQETSYSNSKYEFCRAFTCPSDSAPSSWEDPAPSTTYTIISCESSTLQLRRCPLCLLIIHQQLKLWWRRCNTDWSSSSFRSPSSLLHRQHNIPPLPPCWHHWRSIRTSVGFALTAGNVGSCRGNGSGAPSGRAPRDSGAIDIDGALLAQLARLEAQLHTAAVAFLHLHY